MKPLFTEMLFWNSLLCININILETPRVKEQQLLQVPAAKKTFMSLNLQDNSEWNWILLPLFCLANQTSTSVKLDWSHCLHTDRQTDRETALRIWSMQENPAVTLDFCTDRKAEIKKLKLKGASFLPEFLWLLTIKALRNNQSWG